MSKLKSLPFHCRLCSRSYSSIKSRARHEKRYHHAATAECPWCFCSVRGGESGLSNHVRMVHTPEICTKCRGRFANFKGHVCRYVNPALCRGCGRVYKGQKQLALHKTFCDLNVRSVCNKPFCSAKAAAAHTCAVCPAGWYK